MHTPLFTKRNIRLCILVAGSLLLFLFLARLLHYDLVATCKHHVYDRLSNPDATNTAFIPLYIRDIISFALMRYMLVISVIHVGSQLYFVYSHLETQQDTRRFPKAVLIFPILLLSVMFFGFIFFYLFVRYLKNITGDMECSNSTNGVSGHTFYAVWCLLWLSYLHVLSTHLNNIRHLHMQKQEQLPTYTAYADGYRKEGVDDEDDADVDSHLFASVSASVSHPLLSSRSRIYNPLWFTVLTWIGTKALLVGCCVMFWMLVITLLYAYHSIQQVILGGSLGLVMTALVLVTVDRVRIMFCTDTHDR